VKTGWTRVAIKVIKVTPKIYTSLIFRYFFARVTPCRLSTDILDGPTASKGLFTLVMNKVEDQKLNEQHFPLQDLWLLLIEDEADIAELLTFVLEEAGARVITASSGHEALKTMECFAPNVLISDIRLPDTDGWSLLAEVRALEQQKGTAMIPAIAITNYSTRLLDQQVNTMALLAGFQKYLSKPLDFNEFVGAVAELAQRQSA
jgi:CheY-like chemotaxis protein